MSSEQTGQFVHGPLEVTTVHTNLAQEVVQITVDKLKLILQAHLRNVERRRDWIAPLGISLTLLIVFPTTEFKAFLGIKAEIWQAAALLGLVLVLFWLAKAVVAAVQSPTTEDVLEMIKRGG